ncbi:concanavalin A-like lectin/glucanase domain-containing protein [Mycena galopus ATCC 62051]|nr:concanavalin A-like lectin/glucanase domain-containing protein [Mycena galopus ATCC 62051]
MTSFTLLGALVFLAVSTTQVVAQNCACGYQDSNDNVWRESIVSDFTQPAGALAVVNKDWMVAADYERQDTGTSTADIQYIVENVFDYQGALGIRASAYNNSGSVYSGELDTQRSDILYGSFRMQGQVPTVPGVVFGFFTYFSDTQEQDIEFLSGDKNFKQEVHYTNQPGQLANGDDNPEVSKDVAVAGADFSKLGAGIHRIDWLPGATTYSYSGTSDSGASKNVPTTASQICLNVWSNGDPEFSGGPPTADPVATVQTMHLYFNSTTLSASKFNLACNKAGSVPLCKV